MSTQSWLRTSVLTLISGNTLTSRVCRLNYRDTVRNPTTSLRQGKAINLSTSVRTGTRGDVSMDWATTNVSRASTLPHPYPGKLTHGHSSLAQHIRSTEFENSVIELKSTREMMDNIDEV